MVPPNDPGERGRIVTKIEGSTSSEVIRTVSVHANKEPEALPSLNDAIDPDALDSVFGPRANGTPRRGGTLVFPYAGYRVRVIGNREVEVEPLPGRD